MKEMIQEFNKNSTMEIDTLEGLIDQFSSTTEEENAALISAARKKLSDVFTIELLKKMDQHFLSSEIMPLLLSAETVSSYDVACAYYTASEDGISPLFIQVIAIQLCDSSEIHVINIQEEQNETS